MGRIQIRDDSREWEITTADWEGVIELQLDDDVEVVVSDDAPYTPDDVEITERQMPSPDSLFGAGPQWLLYAPTLLGLLALGLDELPILAPLSASISWAVLVGIYWAFFLVAVVGTLVLYNDALDRGDGADWTANPWGYILGGGLGVAAIHTAVTGVPGGSMASTLTTLAGVVIVGCAVSSAVAGPIYLLVRRRTAG